MIDDDLQRKYTGRRSYETIDKAGQLLLVQATSITVHLLFIHASKSQDTHILVHRACPQSQIGDTPPLRRHNPEEARPARPSPKPMGGGADIVRIPNPPLGSLCHSLQGTRLVVGTEYSSTTSKGSYSQVRHVKGTEIKSYYPPSTYKTFRGGIYDPFPKNHHFPIETSSIAFVAEQLNIDDRSLKFRKSVSSAIRHRAIIDQAHDGIPFLNAKVAVSFDSQNQVETFGSSIVKLDPAHVASPKPSIPLDDAIRIAEDMLDGNVLKDSTIANYLWYLAKEDGTAVLAYVFVVMDAAISRRLQAFVDAHSGHLLSIEDMVFHASPTNF